VPVTEISIRIPQVRHQGNSEGILEGMLRILSGQFGSRRLKTPKDKSTRPWTGRAKESVFNQLRGHLQDANVLDLFAGVGTMGLEAVSRGAKSVVLVEHDRKIFNLLKENISILDCKDQAVAVQADALSSIPLLRVPKPLDIAFVDPPYAMMSDDKLRLRVFKQVQHIAPLLDPEGFIVVRTPVNPDVFDHSIEGLGGPEIHKKGAGMWVLYYWTPHQ